MRLVSVVYDESGSVRLVSVVYDEWGSVRLVVHERLGQTCIPVEGICAEQMVRADWS